MSSANTTEDIVFDLALSARLNSEPVIPELVESLISEARDKLTTRIERNNVDIGVPVFNDLLDWYSKMVSRILNNLLIQRYSSYFLSIHPFWRPKNSSPGNCKVGAPRDILDEYISWEMQTGLVSDQGPYPELSRLLKLTCVNWLEAVDEFFSRITLHAVELSDLIGGEPASLERLTSVTFGISDPHENGRTAAILSFGKRKIVYKPRTLDGEFGWNHLLNFLMKEGAPYTFSMLEILKFDGYGFMEFVEPLPCENVREVEHCFERYGAILSIAHAFGTYDLHHENIIVSKDCPIVVDAETLFRSILGNSARGEKTLKLDKSMAFEDIVASESVSDIGILPFSLVSQLNLEENRNVDYVAGALFPFGDGAVRDYVPCGIGSNDLQLLEKTFKATTFPNLPLLDGSPQLPKNHLESIERGYRAVHHFLAGKKDVLLNQGALIGQLARLKLRILVRPTMQYGLVFMRSISVQLLNSYEKRKQKIIEDLRLLGKWRLDNIDNLMLYEVEQILNGDIPRFDVKADDNEIFGTTFISSPIELVKQRFQRKNSLELELQVVTIKQKIIDRAKVLSQSHHRSAEPGLAAKHAYEIIESIIETTQWQEGTPFWTYTSYAPGYGCTMVHADPESLYDGVIGTAIAIGEAGRLLNNPEWIKISKSVFNPILRGKAPVSVARGGGLARGLGGLIYAMIRIAEVADDAELINAASALCVEYSENIYERKELDEVLYGRGGYLLALIALYKRHRSPDVAAIIEKTAQGLIDRAVQHDNGMCWKVLDGHSICNLSHGTSGISMALARWYELSGDPKAKEIVQGAIRYDDSFWDEKENGWIDARVERLADEARTTWSWCNGRSGGLLARLAISEAMKTSFLDDYTSRALNADRSDIFEEASPGLCCGTAGLLDVLLKINELYPTASLQDSIGRATDLVAVHSPASHYSNLTPGLFTGTSGLAFALLRAANPIQVKSLLWIG